MKQISRVRWGRSCDWGQVEGVTWGWGRLHVSSLRRFVCDAVLLPVVWPRYFTPHAPIPLIFPTAHSLTLPLLTRFIISDYRLSILMKMTLSILFIYVKSNITSSISYYMQIIYNYIHEEVESDHRLPSRSCEKNLSFLILNDSEKTYDFIFFILRYLLKNDHNYILKIKHDEDIVIFYKNILNIFSFINYLRFLYILILFVLCSISNYFKIISIFYSTRYT